MFQLFLSFDSRWISVRTKIPRIAGNLFRGHRVHARFIHDADVATGADTGRPVAPFNIAKRGPGCSCSMNRPSVSRPTSSPSLSLRPPRLPPHLSLSLSPPFDPSFLVKKPRWVDSALSGGYFARFFLATSRSWRMKKRRRGRKGALFFLLFLSPSFWEGSLCLPRLFALPGRRIVPLRGGGGASRDFTLLMFLRFRAGFAFLMMLRDGVARQGWNN